MDLKYVEKQIIKIIKSASKIYYHKEFFEVEEKHKYPKDIVTSNDINTQEYLREKLVKLIPGSCFIGEEGNAITCNSYTWILDPIDGTQNYKKFIPIYGTQLALQHNKKTILSVIYFPTTNELYVANQEGATLNGNPIAVSNQTDIDWSLVLMGNFAEYNDIEKQTGIQIKLMRNFRSIRIFGCVAYNYSLCSCGKMEAVVIFGNTPWDLEPGQFLVKMAGGATYSNNKLNIHISGNPELIKKIKKLLEV